MSAGARHVVCAIVVVVSGIAMGLIGCGASRTSGPTVTVFAAASTVTALDEIARDFEGEHDAKVILNLAGSATLAQQIAQGAAADVFISADPRWVDDLDQRGLVARRTSFLGNGLVLVVPERGPSKVASVADLAKASVERVAIGDPASVPAGAYARQALEHLGLWNAVAPKAVRATDVRQTLLYVEGGEVDAGIVYSSDAATSTRVRVVQSLDADLAAPIRYAVALLKDSAGKPAAESFYAFLDSEAALGQFEAAGFRLVSAAPADRP